MRGLGGGCSLLSSIMASFFFFHERRTIPGITSLEQRPFRTPDVPPTARPQLRKTHALIVFRFHLKTQTQFGDFLRHDVSACLENVQTASQGHDLTSAQMPAIKQ